MLLLKIWIMWAKLPARHFTFGFQGKFTWQWIHAHSGGTKAGAERAVAPHAAGEGRAK